MKRFLLCPMQIRLNDVVLNEQPKFLTAHPTDQDHTIVLDNLTISLDIYNVASFFHVHTANQREYEECERIKLTYPPPEWNPDSNLYTEEGMKCVDIEGYARIFRVTRRPSNMIHDDGEFIRCINALTIYPTDDESEIYNAYNISALKS
jgi:hypothetical protein